MKEEIIKSAQNPKVKRLRKLMKSRAERDSAGLFPVEGIRMVREIQTELLDNVYLSESGHRAGLLEELPEEAAPDAVILGDDLFKSISDTKNPQGILALVRKKEYSLAEIAESGRPVIILEALQDPGNMGTILRSLEASGGGGLVCDAECADVYSLKTIRSTMGAIFRVPHVTAADLAAVTDTLKAAGYRIYAAHLAGEKEFTQIGYGEKTAFLIGNEGRGLSGQTAALADEYLRIPMEGAVESLNAAVAASLLLYEVKRQLR